MICKINRSGLEFTLNWWMWDPECVLLLRTVHTIVFITFHNRTARKLYAIYLDCHFLGLPFPLACPLVQCPGRKEKSNMGKLTTRNKIIVSFVPFHISSPLLTVLDLSCLLDCGSFIWAASETLSSDQTSLKSLPEVPTDCTGAMYC